MMMMTQCGGCGGGGWIFEGKRKERVRPRDEVFFQPPSTVIPFESLCLLPPPTPTTPAVGPSLQREGDESPAEKGAGRKKPRGAEKRAEEKKVIQLLHSHLSPPFSAPFLHFPRSFQLFSSLPSSSSVVTGSGGQPRKKGRGETSPPPPFFLFLFPFSFPHFACHFRRYFQAPPVFGARPGSAPSPPSRTKLSD